jgi:GNAT superfamily N-acetyltransferase
MSFSFALHIDIEIMLHSGFRRNGLEKTGMIVRLHNLSSRAPLLSDIEALVELRIACDLTDFGCEQVARKDIEQTWQADTFNRSTDAWIVQTRKGLLVGYADVRVGQQNEMERVLASSLYVHPDYRGRGIGTLFTLLTEERARELSLALPGRVVLRREVGTLTVSAHRLLQREAYTLTSCYWRVTFSDEQECLTIDLPIERADVLQSGQNRTGFYTAQHYSVYEKVVCSGQEPCTEPLVMESVANEPLATL